MSRRYLIDTHVFLELAQPGFRHSPAATSALNHPGSEIFLSVASVAEMAIKFRKGKLALPPELTEQPVEGFRAAAAKAGFEILAFDLRHAAAMMNLPIHHKDPFDRFIICQALTDDLTLISRDSAFPAYQGLALLRP